jgi:Fe-S-cluster-containing dehydrogenase component
MEKKNILVDAKKCIECLCCQLQCSFAYTGAFNPEKARIVIGYITDPGQVREIRFTDECVEGCSLCAKYCPLGALTRRRPK